MSVGDPDDEAMEVDAVEHSEEANADTCQAAMNVALMDDAM